MPVLRGGDATGRCIGRERCEMIISSMDRRHVSQSRCWDQLYDAQSGEAFRGLEALMRALLTLAAPKANGRLSD